MKNCHFESMLTMPECIFSRSLREVSHYAERRGGSGVSPQASYSDEMDALRIDLPPSRNDLMGAGPQYRWGSLGWDVNDRIVIQLDQMITKQMRELCPTPGTNGRFSRNLKFTNVTSGSRDAIYCECRPWFTLEQGVSHVDFRRYPPAGEGRTDRDAFASHVADASLIGRASGPFDSHPGPDSSMVNNRPMPHPQQFKLLDDTWVRVTYEFTRVQSGCRVRIWLADESNGPSLVVSSPTSREIGFLLNSTEQPTGFYIELDSSQETEYAEPMPERPCYFRNLLVFRNVRGETVLGGRPLR